MNTKWMLSLTAACLSVGAASSVPARADVRLPALFSDNMVLQRDRPVPVWGWADAGEAVTVRLGAMSAQAVADAAGDWKVTLPPQPTALSLQLSVAGKNVLTRENVALGEVWLCSGQSNMERRVDQAANATQEIAAANFPNIRLFSVKKAATLTPQSDVSGQWVACSPQTISGFSAVGYFFGRELHQKLGVPIGLINSTWGGTPAEAWTSRAALEADPQLKPIVEASDKGALNYPANLETYQKQTLPAWQAEADKARAAGLPEPKKPSQPRSPTNQNRSSNLFNGMIAPLVGYSIKGTIWYQGESNAGRAAEYRTLFPAMIRDWRARWNEGDFPFLWVQLANFQGVQKKPVETGGWPMLREAQTLTLSLPRTGMATAIDLADADNPSDIHPKNKQEVGRRLALIALATEYGYKLPYSGPVFDAMTVENGKLRLHFAHTDGGLQARGDKLNGFAIAGADGQWQWADAVIEGDTVVLSSAAVAAPTMARYDWAINPIGNLYNGAGLPAIPFRTDAQSPA